mmetsp:Transcript_48494/g.125841  ORF Transcript_48494/g.125841 Transcript_48494/m.125841 type:complete len:93 (+) Transcript_48494:533-811(+)
MVVISSFWRIQKVNKPVVIIWAMKCRIMRKKKLKKLKQLTAQMNLSSYTLQLGGEPFGMSAYQARLCQLASHRVMATWLCCAGKEPCMLGVS